MPTSVKEASFADLTAELERRRVTKAKEVVEIMLAYNLDVDALVQHGNLPLSSLGGGNAGHGRKRFDGSSAPCYGRYPNDPQAWRGRGRRPLWLIEELERKGRQLEEFLIVPDDQVIPKTLDRPTSTSISRGTGAAAEALEKEPLLSSDDEDALRHALLNGSIDIRNGDVGRSADVLT